MPLGSSETLALTGMMGAGKTTVARVLGRLLSRPVASTDAWVVARAGKSIERIFAEDGEASFRALEREAVRSLRGPIVADLGGGAFCDPSSAAHLLKMGPVVFLDVPPGVALARIGAAPGRPLARAWTEILAARLPSYRRATLRIPVGDLTAEAVARRILGELGR